MTLEDRVRQLLNTVFEQKPDLFLIKLSVTSANQIKVILDSDAGLTLDVCVEVSRSLEASLDLDEFVYSLEVASAGVSEGITHSRQYLKNVQRKLVVVSNGVSYEGTLTKVFENTLFLEWKERVPKTVGKGKMWVDKEVQLDIEAVDKAHVVVEFN